ncbi:MAG: DNA-binding protein, partial [Burkholderia vietnamiensis]|nr:DNA-binding protein [Burkholderia vietnamiensis]
MASSSAPRRTPAGAAPQPPAATPPRVGEQIQRLRNERKLTLDDL